MATTPTNPTPAELDRTGDPTPQAGRKPLPMPAEYEIFRPIPTVLFGFFGLLGPLPLVACFVKHALGVFAVSAVLFWAVVWLCIQREYAIRRETRAKMRRLLDSVNYTTVSGVHVVLGHIADATNSGQRFALEKTLGDVETFWIQRAVKDGQDSRRVLRAFEGAFLIFQPTLVQRMYGGPVDGATVGRKMFIAALPGRPFEELRKLSGHEAGHLSVAPLLGSTDEDEHHALFNKVAFPYA